MSFANTYFKRFQAKESIIKKLPSKNLFLTVVIPVFNEPDLCSSLQSLKDCIMPKQTVEVIVLINSAENSSENIVLKNMETYKKAKKFASKNNDNKICFHILNFENLPKKFAGVGLARKIGMDEALQRYNFLNKPNGLIAGFDADALVEKNYFIEIENHFKENPKTNACSIDFQHPIEGTKYPDYIYKNIINYELHLRYFVEILRFINYPFAFHTIGSSFVVRADIYAKQGGMNRKKAGEDFYFLQKIIPLGNYCEINLTKVIPSPRISDRVPFGTGAAISKMIENNTNEYSTYSFESFILLKLFFKKINSFFISFKYEDVQEIMQEFLKINNFEEDLKKIKNNSPNINVFTKRFFDWFNAFRVIKFLNFSHEKYFIKKKVKSESVRLLKEHYPKNNIPNSEKEILLLYRKIQTKTIFNLI